MKYGLGVDLKVLAGQIIVLTCLLTPETNFREPRHMDGMTYGL